MSRIPNLKASKDKRLTFQSTIDPPEAQGLVARLPLRLKVRRAGHGGFAVSIFEFVNGSLQELIICGYLFLHMIKL